MANGVTVKILIFTDTDTVNLTPQGSLRVILQTYVCCFSKLGHYNLHNLNHHNAEIPTYFISFSLFCLAFDLFLINSTYFTSES